MITFQSTPSSRKVTENCIALASSTCISIHTFLAEGDFTTVAKVKAYNISIHTFLAEGDPFVSHVTVISVISIHTFLAEGDKPLQSITIFPKQFQSTPSSRKVTIFTI